MRRTSRNASRTSPIVLAPLVALVLALATSAPANASSQAAKVVAVPSAPVTLSDCRSDGERRYSDVTNRTKNEVRSFSVDWTLYDGHQKKLGGGELEYQLDPPLASGDSGSYFEDVPLDGFGIRSGATVVRVTCRIAHASFAGGKRWARGEHWGGTLIAIGATEHQDTAPASAPAPGAPMHADDTIQVSSSSDLRIVVVKAWNDLGNPGLFVHDEVLIQGGSSDVPITPANFVLTVKLANGGRKTYNAMTGPAPDYIKMNAMGILYPAHTVDPSNDLGAIGSLIVPAGGTVKVILTFPVPEGLANPTANNNVVLVR